MTSVVRDDHANLYVADELDKRIAVFDSTGMFVRSLGREGAGPAEYERYNGILEKDLVLRLGFIVAEEFVRRGFDVRLTRTGDYDVPWDDRRAGPKADGAAMLFMLHFNADPEDTSKRGAEIRVQESNVNSARLASIVEAGEESEFGR